jgi:hypothetical protein
MGFIAQAFIRVGRQYVWRPIAVFDLLDLGYRLSATLFEHTRDIAE